LVHISYHDDPTLVFQNLSERILQHTQSLDILSRPPLPQLSSAHHLPTWVPDWSICSTTGRIHSFGIGPRSLAGTEARSGTEPSPRFRSAGDSTHTPSCHTTSKELVVEGYCFDKVLDAGPIFEGTELPTAMQTFGSITRGWRNTSRTFLDSRKVIIAWQQMVNSYSDALLTSKGQSLDELFWQTICAGELFESSKVASAIRFWKRITRYSGTFATYIPRWLDNIGISFCISVLLWQILFRQPLLEYELQGRYTLNRRMVITETGYLALAGCSAAIGDHLAICKGSTVPLVLRPAAGQNRWNLVGDAYVHGIMKGEIFEENKCKPLIIL
jgi:hypothetical protein